MLETTSTELVTSIITATIAIAMATIFFCCWGKKESVDQADEVSPKGDNHHDSSVKCQQPGGNEGDANDSKDQLVAENGTSTPVQSNGFVEDTEDLGDFSVVSRETEILRSYRKPPPPKNRARQSRAPRALMRSNENLDIFTELAEDNGGYIDRTDGNRPNSSDDNLVNGHRPDSSESDHTDASLDSSLLRPRSAADRDGLKREDVRSSMLADIEQTLAALHSRSNDDTGSKGSSRSINEAAPSVVKDKATPVSSRPASYLSTDIQNGGGGSSVRSSASSSNQSPRPKPKIGPKVSPKPVLKLRASPIVAVTAVSDSDTESQSGGDTYKARPNSALLQQSVAAPENPPISITPQVGDRDTKAAVVAELTQALQSSQHAKVEGNKDTTASLQSTQHANNQGNNRDNTASVSEEDKPESSNDSPTPVEDNNEDKNVAEEASEPDSIANKPDSPTSRPNSDEITTKQHEKQEDVDRPADILPATTSSPPAADETSLSVDPADQPPQADPEAAPDTKIETSTIDASEESAEHKDGGPPPKIKKGERQDSLEDSSCKGKGSRIPVRAGSKPRSSPPKTEKTAENPS